MADYNKRSFSRGGNTEDYYLVIIHGLTSGRYNNNFQADFKNISNFINFFSSFDEAISLGSITLGNGTRIDPYYTDNLGHPKVRDEWLDTFFNYITEYNNGSIINDNITTVRKNAHGHFNVPPIMFSVSQLDLDPDNYTTDPIGIYKYSSNGDRVKIVDSQDLYNYLPENTTSTGMHLLSYQNIFDLIFKHDKFIHGGQINKNLKFNIGFYCCRSVFERNETSYSIGVYQSLFSDEYNIFPRLYGYPTVNSDLLEGDDYFLPLYIKTNSCSNEQGWIGAIQGQKTQGCGLNVLTFYNILLDDYAAAKLTCLNNMGTSIFRIIEYLHVYLTNRHQEERPIIRGRQDDEQIKLLNYWLDKTYNPAYKSLSPDTKYRVLRYPITFLEQTFIKIIKNILFSGDTCFTFITKLYTDYSNNGKVIHKGHTISFIFSIVNSFCSIYLVDPQMMDINQMTEKPSIVYNTTNFSIHPSVPISTLLKYYFDNGRYKYFDVIYMKHPGFIDHKKEFLLSKKVKLDEYFTNINSRNIDSLKSQQIYLIEYDDSIKFGGINSNIKIRKNGKSSRGKSNKNSKSSKRKSTKNIRIKGSVPFSDESITGITSFKTDNFYIEDIGLSDEKFDNLLKGENIDQSNVEPPPFPPAIIIHSPKDTEATTPERPQSI